MRMTSEIVETEETAVTERKNIRLSYKFQRLREAIRKAIAEGSFERRLPGERELGRLFHANAKTINKALSDLCSEGLLIRQIGRGTFVADNGQGCSDRDRKQFVNLAGRVDPGTNVHSILDAVRREVTGMGHSWTDADAVANVSGNASLSGWPSSKRRETDGLICFPSNSLGRRTGGISEACLSEAYRRHVPVVMAGAGPETSKVSAVVPDYSDAGFRLAEFSFQSGCSELVVLTAASSGREVECVLGGCLASASRRGRTARRETVELGPESASSSDLSRILDEAGAADGMGIVCVGADVLRLFMSRVAIAGVPASANALITCVTEPGDRCGELAGITSYDVDATRIASWAVRLLVDTKPGDRPTEVVIPGHLTIRPARAEAAFKAPSVRESTSVSEPSASPATAML